MPYLPCFNTPGASEDLTPDDGVSIVLYDLRSSERLPQNYLNLNLTEHYVIVFRRKWRLSTAKMRSIVKTLLSPLVSTVIFVAVVTAVGAVVAADVNTGTTTDTITPDIITIGTTRTHYTGRVTAATITAPTPGHTDTIGIARAAAGVERPESRRAAYMMSSLPF